MRAARSRGENCVLSPRRIGDPRFSGEWQLRSPDEAPAVSPTASPAPGAVLVATKLYVPELRPGMVSRRDLVARLLAGGHRKLALLCAPAGWGKTMLLSEWQASPEEARPFAWVSLDR